MGLWSYTPAKFNNLQNETFVQSACENLWTIYSHTLYRKMKEKKMYKERMVYRLILCKLAFGSQEFLSWKLYLDRYWSSSLKICPLCHFLMFLSSLFINLNPTTSWHTVSSITQFFCFSFLCFQLATWEPLGFFYYCSLVTFFTMSWFYLAMIHFPYTFFLPLLGIHLIEITFDHICFFSECSNVFTILKVNWLHAHTVFDV